MLRIPGNHFIVTKHLIRATTVVRKEFRVKLSICVQLFANGYVFNIVLTHICRGLCYTDVTKTAIHFLGIYQGRLERVRYFY
jgi:hypothetical protein